jgi:hypothetical protein
MQHFFRRMCLGRWAVVIGALCALPWLALAQEAAPAAEAVVAD